MKREITLGCLLGLLSLSACGGSSSQAIGNGTAPDAGGSAGQAGRPGVAGAATGAGGASNGSAGAGSGSAGSVESAGKPKLGCAGWQLDLIAGGLSNATLVAGGVKLSRPVGTLRSTRSYFNGAEVALEQTGLVGDFDITIGFKDFIPGDAVPFSGPRLAAGVWWHNIVDSRVYQANGMVGLTTAGALVSHRMQYDNVWLNPSPAPSSLVGASGTFRIKRAGSVVTVETTVNGQVASAQSDATEPFAEEPLTLFIEFANLGARYDEPSTVEAGATISSVQVTGGGGQVKSDDFSCP